MRTIHHLHVALHGRPFHGGFSVMLSAGKVRATTESNGVRTSTLGHDCIEAAL